MTQQPNHPWQPIETVPDNTHVLVAWVGVDAIESGWIETGFWHGRLRHGQPDFWREMPPGPYDEPENAKLLAACKKFLEKWHRQGLDANLQLEKFDVVARDMEIAIDAEGSHA